MITFTAAMLDISTVLYSTITATKLIYEKLSEN